MSPRFFDDFYRPHLEEIGKALGHISLHSYGDFSHVFHNLTAIPCLKAVNAGQMTVEQLVKAGLDSKTVAIVLSDIDHAGNLFERIQNSSLRIDLSLLGIWPVVDGRPVQPDEMTKQLWDELRRKDEAIAEHAIKCAELSPL